MKLAPDPGFRHNRDASVKTRGLGWLFSPRPVRLGPHQRKTLAKMDRPTENPAFWNESLFCCRCSTEIRIPPAWRPAVMEGSQPIWCPSCRLCQLVVQDGA